MGLAQALVHDPEVIILDEPTVGLDPKQIIEVRHLIKSLAGTHTIILSTHILPEVSMTCDRVVIINRGKIVAVDTPANLTTQLKGGQRVHLEAQAEEQPWSPPCRKYRASAAYPQSPAWPAVSMSAVEAAQGEDIRNQLAAKIVGKAGRCFELRGVNLSLEDIFLELTTDDSHHADHSTN